MDGKKTLGNQLLKQEEYFEYKKQGQGRLAGYPMGVGVLKCELRFKRRLGGSNSPFLVLGNSYKGFDPMFVLIVYWLFGMSCWEH